jgi:L-threonylcarbamoyladenylate synthase
VTKPIETAAHALARGELVVLPTDTVYGLAASPSVLGATARLFEAKSRPRDLTLPVLAASIEDVERAAALDPGARVLAGRYWPGRLTIVLPRTAEALDWDLGEERDSVGVRIPAHALARALLHRTGPLAVTSANRSGLPTPPTCEEVRAEMGDSVAMYLCDDPVADLPSTIVDLAHGPPRVLREGSIPAEEVLGALS